MKYTVVLQRTEEGISVGCPGLPGCWSQGATEPEALENIHVRAAIRESLVREATIGRPDLLTAPWVSHANAAYWDLVEQGRRAGELLAGWRDWLKVATHG